MTIRIHLSRLMGEHKLKISDLQRATALPRSLLTAMYNEEAQRIDLDAIEKICVHFKCPISSLLELQLKAGKAIGSSAASGANASAKSKASPLS